MYLQEAFRALDALNEDTFSVSDDGINKLAEFQNNDDLTDDIKVIDPDAETEEDLQDSYVGKVILDCSVCHSKLYKDKEEVELDEEGLKANVGEECPYCYTSDGFNVVGEVATFGGSIEGADDDDAEEVNDDSEDAAKDKDADDNDTVEESLAQTPSEEEITDKKSDEKTEPLTEAYEDVDGIMGEKGTKWTDDQLKSYFDSEKDNDPVLKAYNGNADKWVQDTVKGMKKVNEGIKENLEKSSPLKEAHQELNHRDILNWLGEHDQAWDDAQRFFKDVSLKEVPQDELVSWIQDHKQLYDDFLYFFYEERSCDIAESKSIKESVNNVNVETDDSIVNVSTDDTGKVTVTTEPNETPAEGGDEVIAPVSPDTQAEIEGNGFEEETPVEDEFIDMDVEEFDEESFDGLGESYLKKVYENVESYRTTDVKADDTKVVVEGLIKFNTGKVGKTSFVFEAKDCTNDGKVRFVGENLQLTRGKKAFTIAGKVNEGKFIAESFRYNYKAKDKKGLSSRIYGTIKK